MRYLKIFTKGFLKLNLQYNFYTIRNLFIFCIRIIYEYTNLVFNLKYMCLNLYEKFKYANKIVQKVYKSFNLI